MRQAKTIALGAFVVLHATTVFSFSIAPDAERAGMHWLRATVENAGIITPIADYYLEEQWVTRVVRTVVQPYGFLASQWQGWSLFAPEPLRKVRTYILEEKQSDTTWQLLTEIGADRTAWWQKGHLLKILRRMESDDRYFPIKQRLLFAYCEEPGTRIRLRRREYEIPEALHGAEWKLWKPEWKEEKLAHVEILCPAI